ncbi:hypothetical protein ECTPHS_05010 [Ectothiorhodospira sp. PHS-1]|uniref:hypothetical protein n=1 Tax=Ectothiorhodospira sp. PHS-1 TaxID=519989 RepID=UPI00024A811B|nr:hypothetical protein [Ectothiorhodospira sp. PHS-1]EHQ52029.1 hypothetical protein ECTPHS_05010 [Ectothiorhodospira sp. PHS-1]
MHELLSDAEHHELLYQEITDEPSKRRTPAQAYLQAALLALASPLTLRQGESDRLHRHLEAHCTGCHIGPDALPDHAGMLYRINLRGDQGPDYIRSDEVNGTAGDRFLQIAPLIRQLRDLVRREHDRKIDNDLIQRALTAWTNTARRRFNRTGKGGLIDVATGLAGIHHCITRKVDADLGKRSTDPTQLSLQEIDYTLRSMEMGISVRYLADMPKDLGSSAWDSIAKGNLVTSTTLLDNGSAPPSPEIQTPQAWQLVDSSAGGFRLRWEQPQAGRVQVGELVGLRHHESGGAGWQLGIVRWMMFHPSTGLEIGVQILAPRSLPVILRRGQRNLAHGQPLEGLMSPTIQILQQTTSLFCPAGAFQVDDEVIVNLAGRGLPVKLTRRLVHSSRFEQFAYEPLRGLPQSVDNGEQSTVNATVWSAI